MFGGNARTTHHDGDRFRQIADPFSKTSRFGVFSPNGSAVWPQHHRKLRAHRHQSGGMTPSKAPTRRRHAARGLRMAQIPHHSQPEVRRIAYKTWHSTGWREKTRPTRGFQRPLHEKTRPAHLKTAFFVHFEPAGRTFSRLNETATAFASSFTGAHETSNAFARPQCRKIKHFA